MRENENRIVNPSAYTTPASVFNTVAVDFENEPKADTESPVLKTLPIPVQTIQELNPLPDEEPTEVPKSASPDPKLEKEPDYVSKKMLDSAKFPTSTSIEPVNLSDSTNSFAEYAKNFSDQIKNYPETVKEISKNYISPENTLKGSDSSKGVLNYDYSKHIKNYSSPENTLKASDSTKQLANVINYDPYSKNPNLKNFSSPENTLKASDSASVNSFKSFSSPENTLKLSDSTKQLNFDPNVHSNVTFSEMSKCHMVTYESKNPNLKNYSEKCYSVSESVRVMSNQVCSQANQPLVEGIYDFGGANVKSCAFMKGNHPMTTTVNEIAAQQMQVCACSLMPEYLCKFFFCMLSLTSLYESLVTLR